MNIVTRGYSTGQLIVARGFGSSVAVAMVWPCRDIIAYLEREIDMIVATEHSYLTRCVLELDHILSIIFEKDFGVMAKLEEKIELLVRWCK